MTHLSAVQIQEFADGTADYLAQATCTKHLAVCLRCRKEVEIQKALMHGARRLAQPAVSRSFTRRVMEVVNPTRGGAVRKWALNNLGSMAGMAGVLAIISTVLLSDHPSSSIPGLKDLEGISIDLTPVETTWNGVSDFLVTKLLLIPVPQGWTGLIVASFGVLAVLFFLDRFLGRHVISGHSRGGRITQ